jgi:homopolymeric O-antigen transport system permease protein
MSIAASRCASGRVTRIQPRRGLRVLDFPSLWEYRELLYFFCWRDIKVRYKQTALGATWALLQPFLTMLIFSVIFGRFAKMPSEGVPYPIFAYCGLLPWGLFAFALSESSNSLVGHAHLITKVYFPRLLVPVAGLLTGLVDFAIAFILLIAMMFYYRLPIHATVLVIPVLLLFAIVTSLGVGLWLSALTVKYRDVRHILPFITQFWLYATPVAYPSSLIPHKWRFLMGINPMSGVVEGFRWALLGTKQVDLRLMALSILSVLILLAGGLVYFDRMESTFADLV